MTRRLAYRNSALQTYPEVYSPAALDALEVLAPLNGDRRQLMARRIARRLTRKRGRQRIAFLPSQALISRTGIRVQDARDGNFEGSDIPGDLKRQWIQGTGPATKPRASTESGLRNAAYALLSGADGWMFDGEDALGQVDTMSLDNQRNLQLAIARDPRFLHVAEEVAAEMNRWAHGFFGRPIVADWRRQLDFTTKIFRARGLHLDDRHVREEDGTGFSASIVDLVLYVVNNHQRLRDSGASIVLYLPKIQTAEEAALWNDLLITLEQHLGLPIGTLKAYVLVEQIEAAFQLMEIRAALGRHFVGFNTTSTVSPMRWHGTRAS
jgi:malate synthase